MDLFSSESLMEYLAKQLDKHLYIKKNPVNVHKDCLVENPKDLF